MSKDKSLDRWTRIYFSGGIRTCDSVYEWFQTPPPPGWTCYNRNTIGSLTPQRRGLLSTAGSTASRCLFSCWRRLHVDDTSYTNSVLLWNSHKQVIKMRNRHTASDAFTIPNQIYICQYANSIKLPAMKTATTSPMF